MSFTRPLVQGVSDKGEIKSIKNVNACLEAFILSEPAARRGR